MVRKRLLDTISQRIHLNRGMSGDHHKIVRHQSHVSHVQNDDVMALLFDCDIGRQPGPAQAVDRSNPSRVVSESLRFQTRPAPCEGAA